MVMLTAGEEGGVAELGCDLAWEAGDDGVSSQKVRRCLLERRPPT